jgi:hypothetical protein
MMKSNEIENKLGLFIVLDHDHFSLGLVVPVAKQSETWLLQACLVTCTARKKKQATYLNYIDIRKLLAVSNILYIYISQSLQGCKSTTWYKILQFQSNTCEK